MKKSRLVEELSGEKVSRQQAWKDKMKEEGRCTICGKAAVEDSVLCVAHLLKARNRYKRKHPDGETRRGRPRKW